MKRTEFDILK